MVSEIYKSYSHQLQEMHRLSPDWGTAGHEWEPFVRKVLEPMFSPRTIIDYGAGKGTFAKKWRGKAKVVSYDPGMPGFAGDPGKAELIMLLDVAEHIPVEVIDEVFRDVQERCENAVFMVISMRPASEQLPDGRNDHVTQRPQWWWIAKLAEFFNFESLHRFGDETACLLKPR